MTPSLEGLPTKAKEARSSHEVRLAPMDTNPVFRCLGDFLWPTLGLFALQLKNHRSGSKSVCSLSIALILKRIDILKSTSPYFLLNKDKLPYSKKKRNWKWKIPHTIIERQTLCFRSEKNGESNIKLWWLGACQRTKRVVKNRTCQYPMLII